MAYGAHNGPARSTLHVHFSENYAVFSFLDNLSAQAPPNEFKQAFTGSAFNQDKYTRLRAGCDKLILLAAGVEPGGRRIHLL